LAYLLIISLLLCSLLRFAELAMQEAVVKQHKKEARNTAIYESVQSPQQHATEVGRRVGPGITTELIILKKSAP